MKNQILNWLDTNALWVISVVIMLGSMGGDGRYIRSWQFDGWFGTILGYGLNLAVDVTSEILSYEFTRHQQDVVEGKARSRKRWLSFLLLVGQAGLLYFAVVFAWRQFSLLKPNEPNWLRWSLACFAPVALVFLGIAQALRDGTRKSHNVTSKKSKIAQPVMKVKPLVDVDIKNWREIASKLNGDRAALDAKAVNEILIKNGYAPKSESTARYWAKDAQKDAK